jgi:phage tail protein X
MRTLMELRFGHDFQNVRIHDDARASAAAESINASAYTVGPDVVFGAGKYSPDGSDGRMLLAHELTHVAQWIEGGRHALSKPREVASPQEPGEREADVLSMKAARGESVQVGAGDSGKVHRRIKESGRVPHGRYDFELSELGEPCTDRLRADVKIRFTPDPSGPATKNISFVQIVKVDFDDPKVTWGKSNSKEVARDWIATQEADKIHETRAGDTLTSISQEHYGTPANALVILYANSQLASAELDSPLPAAIRVVIPQAIPSGFHVDIAAEAQKQRMWAKDPNVSADYTGGTVRKPGWNLSAFGLTQGNNQAEMTDTPGGGVDAGWFEFETAAHAKDPGIYYGAVSWGFHYDPCKISGEWVHISPNPSDKIGASLVALDTFFGNKHIVQQGETPEQISSMYFGSTARVPDILRANPGLDPDLTAVVPVKTEIEIPMKVWRQAAMGGQKKSIWAEASDATK